MMFTLTQQESSIFSLLQKVVATKSPDTEIRVAGGWVRDKLLGKESSDIDITLSNITGYKFAHLINEYLQENGQHTHNVAVIEANPDQSKHLETAIVNLFGNSIDFVNLRSETYTDSRIPEVTFGTPLQDAQRRDLTINAIFYNITDPNNMFVEDLVGGVNDLDNRIANTPTNAERTFLDDPLRILRVIRFAAKFNLTLNEDISKATHAKEVQEAFRQKVSVERIWAEMVGGVKQDGTWKPGFLNGPNPRSAVLLVYVLGLRDVLLYPKTPDEHLNPWDMDQNNKYHDLNVWSHTMLAFTHLTTRIPLVTDPEEAAIRHLALLLHDLGKLDNRYRQLKEDGTNSFHRHEERSAELASQVLTDLGAPNNIRERVVKLIAEHCRFMCIDEKSSKSSLRRIIRDLGKDWENLVDISQSDAYGKMKRWDEKAIGEMFNSIKEKMRGLLNEQAGKTTAPRPINGNDLKTLGIQPGPMMGQILKAIDEALLDNPAMTKEEALELAKTVSVSLQT